MIMRTSSFLIQRQIRQSENSKRRRKVLKTSPSMATLEALASISTSLAALLTHDLSVASTAPKTAKKAGEALGDTPCMNKAYRAHLVGLLYTLEYPAAPFVSPLSLPFWVESLRMQRLSMTSPIVAVTSFTIFSFMQHPCWQPPDVIYGTRIETEPGDVTEETFLGTTTATTPVFFIRHAGAGGLGRLAGREVGLPLLSLGRGLSCL